MIPDGRESAAPGPEVVEGESSASSPDHHVVIIGCGFGGLFAARALKGAPVLVTLIDRRNHHLFQPLLYQLTTGILSEGQIAPPIRDVLRGHAHLRVVLAEVTRIDMAHRVVHADEFGRPVSIHYDSLIVAGGAEVAYFGHDEFRPFVFPMKSLDDAMALRGQIFGSFELAEAEDDVDERRRLMTFVVVEVDRPASRWPGSCESWRSGRCGTTTATSTPDRAGSYWSKGSTAWSAPWGRPVEACRPRPAAARGGGHARRHGHRRRRQGRRDHQDRRHDGTSRGGDQGVGRGDAGGRPRRASGRSRRGGCGQGGTGAGGTRLFPTGSSRGLRGRRPDGAA